LFEYDSIIVDFLFKWMEIEVEMYTV